MSYTRYGIDQIRKKAEEVSTDLNNAKPSAMRAQFTASSGNPFNDKPDPDAKKDIYPTDVMKVDCKLPNPGPVAKLEVNKAVNVAPPSAEPLRDQHTAAVTNYLEADQKIKGQFIDALKEQDRDVGNALEGMLAAPGGGSTAVDSMRAMDPGVGDLYSALSNLMKENPSNDRVAAAIDKTLSGLQDATIAQKEAYKAGKAPAPEIDWTKFKTSEQVMNFMTRNVENDPFMKEADDVDLNIQAREENTRIYEEEYLMGAGKLTMDKLETANDGLKKTMLGDEGAKILEQTGNLQAAMKQDITAGSIEGRLRVEDLLGVKVGKPDVSDLGEGVKDITKMLLNNEPPKHMMRAENTPMVGV